MVKQRYYAVRLVHLGEATSEDDLEESRVDAGELELRNLTYAKVVELGRVPAVAEAAASAGLCENAFKPVARVLANPKVSLW